MAVLQRDQSGLEGPQHQIAPPRISGAQSSHVNPDRRRELHLDDRGETDDDHAEEKDDEDRRAVAGILRREVEPADFARRPHAEHAGEQRPCRSAGSGSRAPRSPDWRGTSPALRAPLPSLFATAALLNLGPARAPAPPVDADKEEEPHDVDEVPVPGRRLEAEMVVRLEVALSAEEADREEGRADDDMEAVEAGRHEEGRGIDPVP